MDYNSVNPQEIILDSEAADVHPTDGVQKKRRFGRMAGGGSSHDRITMAQIKSQIAAYWKNGDTYIEICDKVSEEFGLEGDERLKPNNVNYHIKTMITYWKEVGLLNINEKQAIALAKWEQIEALATEAYFNSMRGKSTKNYERQIERAKSKDREKRIREEIEFEREQAKAQGRRPKIHDLSLSLDGLVETSEKIKEYERYEDNLAGSYQFLRLLFDIHDRRCRMWNLYATPKDANSPDQDLARLPDTERESRVKAMLMTARTRKLEVKAGLAEPAPLGGTARLNKVAQERAEGIPLGHTNGNIPISMAKQQNPRFDVNLADEDF